MIRLKLPAPLICIAVILMIPTLSLFQPGEGQPEQLPSDVQTIAQAIPTFTSDTPREEITFKLLHHDTGKVEEISDLDYIKGVVAAEMPISFEPEALKAQAVAAHTYALRRYYQQLQNPSESLKGAQFSTDPSVFQAYKSVSELKKQYGDKFEENWRKLSDAVESVIDYVITYDDQPIVAAYHSMSNGETEAAASVWGQDVPYLQPAESDGDLLAPNYQTEQSFSVQEVREKLTQQIPEIQLSENPSDWFAVKSHTASGAVDQIAVGDQVETGQKIRTIFGLKSASFEISVQGEQIIFTTKGYGHGVGMSQYGANYLAQQGNSFQEILEHYYSGVKICKLSDDENK